MHNKTTRQNHRTDYKIRNINIKPNYIQNAQGSCLINFGNTSVICTANIENNVPEWLKGNGQGWLTAEYSMIPSATENRNQRESIKGKISGRTHEIQRLIGRSLRNAIDLNIIGEKQINIDCDVINADGGTRTAAITGGWIALKLAVNSLLKLGILKKNPIINQIAAISCGIYNGRIIIDLDYLEDSSADTDANFVIAKPNKIIEIQSTAEKKPFDKKDLNKMLNITFKEINNIFFAQDECFKNEK